MELTRGLRQDWVEVQANGPQVRAHMNFCPNSINCAAERANVRNFSVGPRPSRSFRSRV